MNRSTEQVDVELLQAKANLAKAINECVKENLDKELADLSEKGILLYDYMELDEKHKRLLQDEFKRQALEVINSGDPKVINKGFCDFYSSENNKSMLLDFILAPNFVPKTYEAIRDKHLEDDKLIGVREWVKDNLANFKMSLGKEGASAEIMFPIIQKKAKGTNIFNGFEDGVAFAYDKWIALGTAEDKLSAKDARNMNPTFSSLALLSNDYVLIKFLGADNERKMNFVESIKNLYDMPNDKLKEALISNLARIPLQSDLAQKILQDDFLKANYPTLENDVLKQKKDKFKDIKSDFALAFLDANKEYEKDQIAALEKLSDLSPQPDIVICNMVLKNPKLADDIVCLSKNQITKEEIANIIKSKNVPLTNFDDIRISYLYKNHFDTAVQALDDMNKSKENTEQVQQVCKMLQGPKGAHCTLNQSNGLPMREIEKENDLNKVLKLIPFVDKQTLEQYVSNIKPDNSQTNLGKQKNIFAKAYDDELKIRNFVDLNGQSLSALDDSTLNMDNETRNAMFLSEFRDIIQQNDKEFVNKLIDRLPVSKDIKNELKKQNLFHNHIIDSYKENTGTDLPEAYKSQSFDIYSLYNSLREELKLDLKPKTVTKFKKSFYNYLNKNQKKLSDGIMKHEVAFRNEFKSYLKKSPLSDIKREKNSLFSKPRKAKSK